MKSRKLLVLLSLFILFSCQDSRNKFKHVEKILVTNFCKNNISEYFQKEEIKMLGIEFSLFEFSTKYSGTENMFGYAEIKSKSFNRSDLIPFINGALRECFPTARIEVPLKEIKYESFYSSFLKKKAVLTRLEGEMLYLYFMDDL